MYDYILNLASAFAQTECGFDMTYFANSSAILYDRSDLMQQGVYFVAVLCWRNPLGREASSLDSER
jgi:hypothetical protein